jgi:xanthine dehydrogenase accessory factor
VPASLSVDHDGGTVWFCGSGCRDAFAADPPRYLPVPR